MLTLTPERLPVKVYKSTDQGAPRLDRSANCVSMILKACLVTGYDDKDGAGWTIPFEDTNAGVKVFRPKVSADTDFYLKVSNDTGRAADIALYQTMSDIDNGTHEMRCDYPFRYGSANLDDTWVVVVSAKSLWFFAKQWDHTKTDFKGVYLFAGMTCKTPKGGNGVYLKHTGRWSDGSYHMGLFEQKDGNGYANTGRLFSANKITLAQPTSFFDGSQKFCDDELFAPICIFANDTAYTLPGLVSLACGAKYPYYHKLASHLGDMMMVVGSATAKNQNLALMLDYWEY